MRRNTYRVIAFLLAFIMALPAFEGQKAKAAENNSHIIKYQGAYDPAAYPQKDLNAVFTSESMVIDGRLDEAAYASAQVSSISNVKAASAQYAYESGKETRGEIRAVWDGPVLYLGIDVYDADVIRTAGTGGESGNPAVAGVTKTELLWGFWPVTTTEDPGDSIELGFDLHNDKVVYETDTQGVVTIGADGHLYYYHSSNIPSLGSPLGDPQHPEYMDRIRGYAVSPLLDGEGKEIGYTVEVGLQIENVDSTNAGNGLTFGVEIKINDYQNVITGYKDVPAPEPASGSAISVPATGSAITVQEPVYETIKLGDIFWSHSQDAVYTKIDHEHTNSVDWGNVALTGWNGTDAFSKSTWRISTLLRYIDSASFAKGVYTAGSQAVLDAAVTKAKAADLDAIGKAEADALAAELEAAFYGLRWGNTKYPDPAELPSVYTLPNPYKFFGTDRLVKNAQDWEERRAEILDLAQFYEYGYKPGAPDAADYSVEYHEAGEKKYRWSNSQQKYVEDGTYTSTAATVKMQLTVGSVTKDISFDITYPTAEQLSASGNEGRQIPILLSYDGSIPAYLEQGIAVVSLPSVVSDTRTNEYAWGNRTGAFYELYPYHRNGVEALGEVSNEMAAAWAATRVIDALEALKASSDETAVKAMASLDPEKLAVTGFSINGKYAFVAGVFDDRIDVCIPGASGASGASAWRLVYTGHQYDFTGTPFASQDGKVPNVQTASGTEMMANSIRHNRVRETELFRHFLKPFDFYGYEDGAYGFGNRLPYDQTDLIATLAPRAIIIENTTNDYNDGCEADALSAEVAKSVYNTLGYTADDLVKFNYRSLKPSDPHGNDPEQRTRSAKYLNSYFFGTEMDDETATRLNTDPFALKVTNSDTPYNVYYGGYNTITGGSGADAKDGWYYYTFPKEEPATPSPDPATPSPEPATSAPDPVIPATEAPAAEETEKEPAAAADEVVETKEETVANEDGSETTTTVTEKADGSVTSVSVTKDEDGNVLSSTTEEEHTKKNGTKVEEITTVNADGSETTSTVKTTKAGNVYVRTEETDADGNVSITIEQNKADGTQTKRAYAVNKDGSLKLTALETGASSVKVPASVTVNGKTYAVTTITKNAFKNNKELEKVVIGKNITAIGKNTFKGDSKLSEIVIYGASLESVSKNAFKGIAGGAVFKIKGDKETYKKVVELLKKSGLDKGVKFKRVK